MKPFPLSIPRLLAVLLAFLALPVLAETAGKHTAKPKAKAKAVAVSEADDGSLTLRSAVARALAGHPALATYSHDMRAAEARAIQAGLKPNPQLIVNAENLPGTGDYQYGNLMERTLQLSQLVELGDKRQARIREAEAGFGAVEWAYQVRRVEVFRDTAKAFVDVLVAQRQMRLVAETAALAEKVTPITQRRVEAGKANAVEVLRSNLAVSSAKIETEQAQRALAAARLNLAAQWGGRTADFAAARGDLETVGPLPSFAELAEKIEGTPEIARWNSEREQRLATLAKQKTLARPDVTIYGGPRTIGRADDITFTVGASIPLPFGNRNQGAIAEAEALVAKTASERRVSEHTVFTQLSAAYQVLVRASREVELLTNDVLPGALKAEEALAQGYEAGRFTQLEILDARRALIQARYQHLRALADYHQALAEIEALTASPVSLPRLPAPRRTAVRIPTRK